MSQNASSRNGGWWIYPSVLFGLTSLMIGLIIYTSCRSFQLLPDPNRFDQFAKSGFLDGNRAYTEITLSHIRLAELLLVIRLAQFIIGQMAGVMLLCLGAYLSWIGVREKIGLELEGPENLRASLSALGPGMVLAICGTAIVVVCLMKQVTFSPSGRVETSTQIPVASPTIFREHNRIEW